MHSEEFAERFWTKVDVRGPDECWLWKASVLGKGYGQIRVPGTRRNAYAHRVALEFKLGRKLEPSEKSCHTCDVPSCCNPRHLFVGTQAENMQDMVAKNRHTWGKRSETAKLTERQVEQIRDACEAGETQRAVAERFDVSQMQVSRIVRGERWSKTFTGPKWQRTPRARPTQEQIEQVCEIRKLGFTHAQIAKLFGVNQSTITKLLLKHGYRSERRMNDEEVKQIRSAVASGLPQTRVAKMFNIDRSTVSRICAREPKD